MPEEGDSKLDTWDYDWRLGAHFCVVEGRSVRLRRPCGGRICRVGTNLGTKFESLGSCRSRRTNGTLSESRAPRTRWAGSSGASSIASPRRGLARGSAVSAQDVMAA